MSLAAPSLGLQFPIDSADGCFDDAVEGCLKAEESILLAGLLTPQSSFENRLNQDVQNIQNSILREEGKVDIVVLASRLAVLGYVVHIRTAMGGGSGQECFRNLNYQFLVVSKSADMPEVFVDHKFRDQFSLCNQTCRYTHLLSFLPDIFVGQHSRLSSLVRLIASEMELAFSETGITMPPWRQAASMMSKWKPLKSRDTEVRTPNARSPTSAGASPRTAWSMCSSRASSECSDTSESSSSSSDSLQRQESIPRKVQTGFCVNPTHAATRKLDIVQGGGNERQPKQTCLQCALVTEKLNTKSKLSSGEGDQMHVPVTKLLSGHKPRHEHLGLTKIRTVRLGGRQ